MDTLDIINTMTASNGIKVCIYDHTKVYFGDYHHVRIKVICSLDFAAVDWQQYCPENIDCHAILYTRILEKMGVPSKEIESVKKNLLRDFDRNAMPYIVSPDFPKKMIKNELSFKKPASRKYIGSGS